MMRDAKYRAQRVVRKIHPVIGRGLHQAPPQLAVRAQRALRMFQVALQNHSRTVVKRMRQRRLPVDPLQSVIR